VAACGATWTCFEGVVNLVPRHASDALIAVNATPDDTFDAAARWLAPPG
jgi:hypothetical protein